MKKNLTMTQGNPMKAILLFAIPLFVGSVFQQLYNAVDSIIVGRFVSEQALAAVGACSSSYNLIIAVVNGFTNGAAVVIAQCVGTQDFTRVRKSYITSVKILLISAVVFSLIGLFLGGYLLRLLGTPEDCYLDALTYMQIMCAGILATCMYNGLAAVLRSTGDSITPLVALIISSITNVILDYVLVVFAGLGVGGVAYATLISQLISGAYCLIYIMRAMPELSFKFDEFSIDTEMGNEMVRLGIPATFSTAVVTVSVMFIQASVNRYGSTVMAAYTASGKTETVSLCLAFSIGMATGVFCGQNLGAGETDRVRQGFRSGMILAIIYATVMGILMFVFAKNIVSLFSTNSEVVEIGYHIVRISGSFAPVLGMVFVLQNFLRNVSDVKPTVYMSFAEIFSRGILPFILSIWFGYYGIWWATPVGWCLSFLIGYIRYISGAWLGKAQSFNK